MPNTLAHIGLQTVLMRLVPGIAVPFGLILLGCIVPDVPWILRRLAAAMPTGPDPYWLFAYASVQASLLVSVFLSAACAAIYRRALLAFAIIASGSLLHLLLDAAQIKWGNGVTLFAPVDWALQSWDFLWPESPITYVVTAAGLLIIVSALRHARVTAAQLTLTRRRGAAVAFFLLLYAALPAVLINEPFDQNSHYLATLRQADGRTGKRLELDRVRVFDRNGRCFVETFAGEMLLLEQPGVPSPGTYSLRARFAGPARLIVDEWHYHSGFRVASSTLGVLLITAYFAAAMVNFRSGKSGSASRQ